jgi:hypothetical protein
MTSIHHMNAHIDSPPLVDHMYFVSIALAHPQTSLCGPNCHLLIGQDIFNGRFLLSFRLDSGTCSAVPSEHASIAPGMPSGSPGG